MKNSYETLSNFKMIVAFLGGFANKKKKKKFRTHACFVRLLVDVLE